MGTTASTCCAYGACGRLKYERFCHLCDMTQNMGCTTAVHHCSHTALREALCSDDAGRRLPNQMRAIWTWGTFVAWVCVHPRSLCRRYPRGREFATAGARASHRSVCI